MTQTAAMQWRRIMPTDHGRRDQPGSPLSLRSWSAVRAERNRLGCVLGLPQNIETLFLVDGANEHATRHVVVFSRHLQLVARWTIEGQARKGLAHFGDVERVCLCRRHRPQVNRVVGRNHGVDGDVGFEGYVLGFYITGPLLEEGRVRRRLGVLQIGPAVEVADQWFGVEPLKVRLDHIQAEHWNVGRLDALIGEFAQEVRDRRTHDRENHDRLAAALVREGANLIDQGLEVRKAQGNVFFLPGRFGYALGFPVTLELLVDGSRPYVIRTEHEEALGGHTLFAHQIVNRRENRAGGRRVHINDVL